MAADGPQVTCKALSLATGEKKGNCSHEWFPFQV